MTFSEKLITLRATRGWSQEQIANRRRKQKDGTRQIFAGLVKCADCGWSMSFAANRQNKTPAHYFHCSRYSQSIGYCTQHYIATTCSTPTSSPESATGQIRPRQTNVQGPGAREAPEGPVARCILPAVCVPL